MTVPYAGQQHSFSTFLTSGKSLHPLQRAGLIPNAGLNVQSAAGQPGLTSSVRPAAQSDLSYPGTLNTSITAATRNPNAHV